MAQKIRFIADSASDIPKETAERLGIVIMPVPISHEGRGFHDGVEYTNQEFYRYLQQCKTIPVTSQVPSPLFAEAYRRAFDEGCTHVVTVTLHAGGSGMYDAARLARRQFYEETGEAGRRMEIAVVDSKSYTVTFGLPVIRAAQMASEGREYGTILDFLYDWFDRAEVIFSVYTLDFLKKSGRVSVAAAFVGEMLGLRPILRMRDGTAEIVQKVRGDKNVVPALLHVMQEHARDPQDYPVGVMAALKWSEGEALARGVEQAFGIPHVGLYEGGASITINSGPNVIALCYAGEKRPHTPHPDE